MNKWVIRKKSGNKKLLAETMGVSAITSQVLINRGLLKEDIIEEFLKTDINLLNDFTEALGVKEAIKTLKDSLAKNEKITIYGDYDVDGVTSSTILYKTLKVLTDNVHYFLPNRHTDGYGLNIKNIDKMFNDGTDLIITCDNGIASSNENDYIQKKGMKHIVIDHHEEPVEKNTDLLTPNAIIDPKQSACSYHFKEMCAAGLSYRFCMTLLKEMNVTTDLYDELLVFAMIGTICDLVPLTSDNRTIVKEGLKIFNENKSINEGLINILYRKDCQDKECSTYTVGFIIGPTINSAGRLIDANLAVELFTTNEEKKVEEISDLLYNLNTKRQDLTKEATDEIISMIENENIIEDKVIIALSNTCDEAVSGIVSGRIKEKYNKPSIVLTKSGEVLKASCRSIECYDIHKELSKLSKYFLKFGGHKMAAGFSLMEDNFDEFKKELLSNCDLTEDDLIRILPVDDILKLAEVSYKEAESLEILRPYGIGNKEPLFASLNVRVNSIKIYEEKNTLVLGLIDEELNSEMKAITFGNLDKFYEIINDNFETFIANKILNGVLRDIDLMLDIVYYIDINEFMGRRSVQLKIEDFRIASANN